MALAQQAIRPTSKFQVLLRVKDLIDEFNSFDMNGDGKISRSDISEVIELMFGYVPSDEEIRRRIGGTDWDGDGCINLQEFIRVNTGEINVYQTSSELQKAFKLMDVDKSGHITANELHRVLKRLGDPASLDDCRQFINALDQDGDGKVTFQEFQVLLPTANSSAHTAPAYAYPAYPAY